MRERLILLRKDLKLSQAKLAEELGVSVTFINLFENGNRNISDRTISDICRIYNVSEEWLRTGKGEMYQPLDREQEVAVIAKRILQADYDDIFAKWVKNLAQLDKEELKVLDKTIKKLAKDEKDSAE